jgi:NitT/TauT family transport system ATP-binding protein
MTAQPSVITLQEVSRRFRTARSEVQALAEVNLDIHEGEFVTVVGPSGCGKSTVLNIIVGLLDPTTGARLFRGVPTKGINLEIGYVTQQDNLFPWRTVLENVMFALDMRRIGSPASRRERAIRLIERVGLKGFEHHYRHELSGGMRQRVNIIRALIYDPEVILLDEPFGPLDAQTRLQLQDLLLKLWIDRPKTTLVFITHDLSEAIALGDRVVVMSARPGRVREIVDVDLPRPRDIYTIHTDRHFREIYDRVWQHLADEMRAAS